MERKKYTEEECQAFITMYRKMRNMRSAAKECGISESSLRAILIRYREPIIGARHKTMVTGKMENEIVADYRNGMSQMRCAKKWGISSATVNHILVRRGVNARTPKEAAPRGGNHYLAMDAETKGKIAELYRGGLKIYQVAAAVGVQRASVRKVLREKGLRTERYCLTNEEKDKIIRMLAMGMGKSNIAMAVARSQRTIENFARKHVDDVASRRREMMEQRVLTHYLMGDAPSYVAEVLKVGKNEIKSLYDGFVKDGYIQQKTI